MKFRRHHRGLLGALLGLLALTGPARAEEQLIDGIAAQVGQEIVLISDVNEAAGSVVTKMKAQGASEREIAMLRSEILERMIERALIRQVVRRADLGASEVEVDQAITAIAEENNITPDQLRASVESQGMPYDAYRARIRDNIEHSKIVNGMVAAKVQVDEEEVRALYDQELGNQPDGGSEYLLAHILMTWRETESHDETCAQVDQARRRIAGGEHFKDVAKAVSENNPDQGGMIGWIHDKNLAGWMRSTVPEMQEGEVSDTLRTAFGCNLLMVVKRRDFKRISYEEAKDKIRQKIWSEKMNTEYASFIEELREQTYIERKGIFADAARLDPTLSGSPSGAPTF